MKKEGCRIEENKLNNTMKMYENIDYFLNNNNLSFTLKKVTLYTVE